MSRFAARVTAVTLGVSDFVRSVAFYEALGFVRKMRATGDQVAMIDGGGVLLSLFRFSELAKEAQTSVVPGAGFRGVTLAWNVETDAEVDEKFALALAAGATVMRPPAVTDYGGYCGYFADPDGHAWEVVRAPGFGFTADGRLILPD